LKQRFLNQKLGKRASRRSELLKASGQTARAPRDTRVPGPNAQSGKGS